MFFDIAALEPGGAVLAVKIQIDLIFKAQGDVHKYINN